MGACMSKVENQNNMEKTGELQPREKALLFCMQGFVERYLGEDWSVCWVDRKDVRGFVEEDSKKIYIAVDQPATDAGFAVANGIYFYKKPFKLRHGEQYFLTLLHEIGHVKIKPPVPKRYVGVRRLLERDYPNDRELQVYNVANYVKQRRNETVEKWQGVVLDIQSWIATGLVDSQHAEIDKWAVREFRRNRGEIREILKECGY
jgi:hypothetical protein